MELHNGRERLLFDNPPSVYVTCIDPTGQFLAAAGHSGRVVLWNLTLNKLIKRFVVPASVFAMCFSPDSRLLAIGSQDVRLFHIATGQRLTAFGGIGASNPHRYEGLAFTDSGDCLFAIHGDVPARGPALRIWDTSRLPGPSIEQQNSARRLK